MLTDHGLEEIPTIRVSKNLLAPPQLFFLILSEVLVFEMVV